MAKEGLLKKIFWPKFYQWVFGKGIPKHEVGQDVVLNPTTVYGISKMAGEKWCEYYFDKYGVDVRSIRYPGLISWKTPAGGGTTDYAVEIFYKAIEDGKYTSFISENTGIPMLYMDDAINATLKLMDAPKESLTVRSSYNFRWNVIYSKRIGRRNHKKKFRILRLIITRISDRQLQIHGRHLLTIQ